MFNKYVHLNVNFWSTFANIFLWTWEKVMNGAHFQDRGTAALTLHSNGRVYSGYMNSLMSWNLYVKFSQAPRFEPDKSYGHGNPLDASHGHHLFGTTWRYYLRTNIYILISVYNILWHYQHTFLERILQASFYVYSFVIMYISYVQLNITIFPFRVLSSCTYHMCD